MADMMVSGVLLSNGRLSGLANMARWGNATLELKYIRVSIDKDLKLYFISGQTVSFLVALSYLEISTSSLDGEEEISSMSVVKNFRTS